MKWDGDSPATSGASVAIAIVLEHYDAGNGVTWPPFDVENVWAAPLGEPFFEVRGIPFYAKDVNVGDVVEARPRDGFSDPVFTKVVRRSGSWTVHLVVIDGASAEAQQLLDRLSGLGCSVDHDDTTGLVAVNVAPAIAAGAVFEILDIGAHENVWDVEIASDPVS